MHSSAVLLPGTALRLERLVLVGFDVASSFGGPQPVLWPTGLISGKGAALAMTDVRMVVNRQDSFNSLRSMFASDSKVTIWTVSIGTASMLLMEFVLVAAAATQK